jgi:hypothetical protein
MKLKAIRVENYKSIYDSGRFEVGGVTCLVGKNEAGKTALLQSLYKLNPAIPADADFMPVMEYPRTKWLDYQSREGAEPDNVLSTEWHLDDDDRKLFDGELGPGALTSDFVTITKGYGNNIGGTLPIDESKVVEYVLASSGLSTPEKQPLLNCSTIAALLKEMGTEATPSTAWKQLMDKMKSRFPDAAVQPFALHIISERLPTVLYFSSYYRLPGQVSIDDLLARKEANLLEPSDQMFLALLDLAEIKPEQLLVIDEFEALTAQLEAVSIRLGKTVFDYWSQNPYVEVEFRFDQARPGDEPPFNQGNVARIRIRNRLHGISVSFDERSSGFVWFFSFLVWFSQLHKTFGDNLLILLDEPATNLHARAQEDLLRYISEELEPKFQVIYSTHSPFMVNAKRLGDVRTVEDMIGPNDESLGTKVGLPETASNPDTVIPVQAALGYDITHNLLVGDHTLLVDNPSDLLYLTWFSHELQRQGVTGLDSRWAIAPLGGLQKIASLVALFGSDKANIAVVTSVPTTNENGLPQDSGLLNDGRIFCPEAYVQHPGAAMEDLIGRDTYVELVNRAYGLYGSRKLPETKPSGALNNVLDEVIAHFNEGDLAGVKFDAYTPALDLLQQGTGERNKIPGITEALDRFEALFTDLNRLLQEEGKEEES